METPKKNPPAAVEEAGLVVMVAIEPIRCDGKDVEPGAEFAVRADLAVALVEAGSADFAGKSVAK